MNAFTSEEAERRVNLGSGGHGIHSAGERHSRSQLKRKPETVARVAAALEAHLARHPRDGQSASHLNAVLK